MSAFETGRIEDRLASFPFGLMDLVLTGCTSSVEVTIDFPGATAGNDVRYWEEVAGVYAEFPADLGSASARFVLVDNGDGDQDPSAAMIRHRGGLGVTAPPMVAIPALGSWGLVLLSGLLALLGCGWPHPRRRAERESSAHFA